MTKKERIPIIQSIKQHNRFIEAQALQNLIALFFEKALEDNKVINTKRR